MTPTLDQQIAEIKREIALRKNVYPKFVANGKMRQAEADLSMERMTAALHTVMAVKRLRATMMEHEGDVHEWDGGKFKWRCACGWESELMQQRFQSVEAWITHVFERSRAAENEAA